MSFPGLLKFLFAACTLLAGMSAHASEPLPVHPNLAHENLGPYMEYLRDPQGKLTFRDITGKYAAEFRDLPGEKISFGFTTDHYWFRFRLQNATGVTQNLFLEIAYPLIDFIRIYEPDGDGGFRHTQLGDHQPFAERPLIQNGFSIPLPVPPGDAQEYYVQVHTTSVFDVPITLSSAKNFFEYHYDSQWQNGLFYGLLAGLLAYNLFIYLSTRERAFLFYILYLVGITGLTSALDGIHFRVFANAVGWQQYASFIYINLTGVFFLLFARDFLALEERGGWVLRTTQLLMGVNLLALALHMYVDISVTSRTTVVAGFLSITWGMVAGVVRLREGFIGARFYVLAFVLFLVLAAMATISALGLIPLYAFESGFQGLKIGIALQLVLLSMALGNRINVLKEQQMGAEQAAIEAHARSDATSEFLAKMSHEIRTPMNGVLGMAELMRDTRLDRIQNHYLNVITSSGRALLGVINDILDFSKIEAGHMELEKVDCHLEELLNETASVFSLTADEKHLEFVLNMKPDVPLYVRVDPTRLRQVILNLLGNAFKFTDRGHILLRVRCKTGPAKREMLRFEVVDSGIGIPASVQRRLFTSFTQADSSITRRYGGTGLGLAISRQLVELMGGVIGVESQPGHGATFWFEIPVENADDPGAIPPFRHFEFPPAEVLLVSGLPAYQQVMTEELAPLGITVTCAGSGAETREVCRAHPGKFRVIVIDKDLPDDSGYAVARSLADMVSPEADMVLVTGLRDNEEISLLQETGLRMAINRPHTCAQFRDTLALLLQARTDTTVETGTPPALESSMPDYSHLKVLIVEDNDVNLMVIRGMLQKLGIRPDTAANGRLALEKLQLADSHYDLVFMDCEMPEMDGYTATRKLRIWENEYRRTPVRVIALSAHVLADARARSLGAGMDDHMAKPVNMSVLIQKIAHWTRSKTTA